MTQAKERLYLTVDWDRVVTHNSPLASVLLAVPGDTLSPHIVEQYGLSSGFAPPVTPPVAPPVPPSKPALRKRSSKKALGKLRNKALPASSNK